MPQPKYELYYWPLPFRGCFVSYLFAYRSVPLLEISDFDEIRTRMSLEPGEQDVRLAGHRHPNVPPGVTGDPAPQWGATRRRTP